MAIDYLLHESSVGYAIFQVTIQADTIGNRMKEVQEKAQDLATFGKMVKLVSFAPFQGAAQALENANDISEGIMSSYLAAVIEANISKPPKGGRVTLGVADKTLAGSIKAGFPYIDCETAETNEIAGDLLRGVRQHSQKLLKQLKDGDVTQAQLGLGHAYSRAKVKFSVQKNDNHVIQAIATLDHMDKAVNTFAMRVREWYSWHFPELIKIVSDNYRYAQLALVINDKSTLNDDKLHEIAAIVDDDEAIAKSIINAAKVSMGRDISESDLEHIMAFATRTVELTNSRRLVANYLASKMKVVAPNLATLIGDVVGARLISKAGSLSNLCKYPASTVQILGAEKALFRALKTKGKTPKYGILYNSSWIGKAGPRNKGRISRYLANKCSIASRIDNFSASSSTVFGEALKSQVEERISYYLEGTTPTKNVDAMHEAMELALKNIDVQDEDEDMEDAEIVEQVKPKKDKKVKKKKRHAEDDEMEIDEPVKKKKHTDGMDLDEPVKEKKKKDKKDKKEKEKKEKKKEKIKEKLSA